ncbi:hypothetical protein [Xenorhabdus stockiae]|uniref:hypothetical protein n=1 Tax=Xenorhabdus stockiae TaxID=351614 RepID=UPI0040643D36
MSVQYILKGYAMSEINFEAIGRCQHLKAKIIELRRSRDRVFKSVKYSYTEPHMDTFGTIHYFDSERLRDTINKLDEINIELMAAVDEYNQWAKDAELPVVKILKQIHHSS